MMSDSLTDVHYRSKQLRGYNIKQILKSQVASLW